MSAQLVSTVGRCVTIAAVLWISLPIGIEVVTVRIVALVLAIHLLAVYDRLAESEDADQAPEPIGPASATPYFRRATVFR